MSPASSRSQPLTREEIVDTSLRLTREHGLEALTMRAVAAELGVTPMAVYYHVKDKEELISLVAEAAQARRKPLELADDGWEQSLRRFLLSTWDELERYPGLGAHLVSLPDMGTTPEGEEKGVQFFEDAGFDALDARLAWSFAMTYMHGRFSVDAHLRGRGRSPRFEGLRARDFVGYSVDAVIAGINQLQAHRPTH